MVSQVVTIRTKLGLYACPAGMLTKLAQNYQSNIQMKVGEKSVNVKSIMGVLSAGVQCGTKVKFVCNGTDEIKALNDTISAVKASPMSRFSTN